MNDFNGIYNFVSGPLVWITFIVFICGSIYRIYDMISLVNKKEKFIWTYMNLKYSLRSIIHWIIPFGTTNWRAKPVLTIITFTFHICLLLMPLFLTAHIILINKAWGISWYSLPDGLADAITLIVISACLFFALRRLLTREVRYLTTFSDFMIILIVAAPFLTGYVADKQYGSYHFWLILHILSGEILLIAIPFTRLSHMLYSVFTRAYLGSEFGGVRHAKDW